MSHTSGTWVAECVGSGGDYDNPIDIYEVNNGYERIAENISEDDAKLIAAAPRLLEALQDLLADITDYQTINKLGGEKNHSQVMARAAIAKATS